MNEKEIREQICDICHKMWQLGWVAANDGNVSVKIDEDTFLATPTGISKSFMSPDKIVKINSKGEILEAKDGYKPSSEIKMHLRCYEERDDVGAVVHAHPPTATGFALAHRNMDTYSLVECVISVGSVPIAKYGTPSTDEVPNAIAPYLPEHDVILLENHGALTVGKDLLTAYYRMETLELWAKTSLVAQLLGEERELSKENIDRLISMRSAYKVSGKHPGYKKYNKTENE
ncbi:class II aldolase/adducin family protein [Clostridium amazonitimonense]|uniref:class II aldolase/adducin family protein n=1 Tax=Clostridium amazonitimonense TaxID=1499689 RepID=UPI000509D479|nr:class II aldolase/adducin family protein [Clostridium amazonitimonense]